MALKPGCVAAPVSPDWPTLKSNTLKYTKPQTSYPQGGLLSTQLPSVPSLIMPDGIPSSGGSRPHEHGAGGQAAKLAEIGKVRVVVERLEARMGRSNPQVGGG